MTAARLLLACKVLTAVAACATAIAVLRPTAADVTPQPVRLSPMAMVPAAPPDSSVIAAARVVETNIFSPTRTAPAARTVAFTGADALAADSAYAGGATEGVEFVTADSIAPPSEDPVPYLYGVVQGVVGDAALLRLESSSRAARLYRVGDGDGGWRVLGIGADFVRLGGAGGERIVRLRRARGARE